MRSSLSTAGRRASVLAAAALVSLITACGPADLGLDAGTLGTTDPTSETGVPGPLSVDAAPGDEVGTPGAEVPVPVPAPVPAAEEPVTTPTEAGAQVEDVAEPAPEEIPTGDGSEIEAEVQAQVPVETARVAAAAEPARHPRNSPSNRPAPAPAPAPAAAVPVAAGTSSGGAGGAYADQPRQSFTAGNGHTGKYLLYAGGIDPAKPVGLVVYLDGTGEFGVDNPSSPYVLGGSSGLVENARARNAITLAVESPDQGCECWHTGDTSGYADFLAELIETQLGDYPVDELWLSGFSSGAQEITRFLVPRHPELMRLGGGWVVFGGGGPPAGSASAVTPASMAGVRGHWYTGTADQAVPLTASWGAQAGESFYADRGVVTSHEWPQGGGHSLDGRLGRTVGQLLDAS